jgi:hypothetical protein
MNTNEKKLFELTEEEIEMWAKLAEERENDILMADKTDYYIGYTDVETWSKSCSS